MKTDGKNKAYLAAVSYSIITGLSLLFGKIALVHSRPLDLLGHRYIFAFIGISLAVIFKWIKLDLNMKMIKKIMPLAIFYPLLFFGFQTFGLELIESSEAAIIQAAMPVFTMIFASYFLKEKSTILQKLSIFLSVAGVIYITYMKSTSIQITSMKGIIFLLISTMSFAMYSVMARKLTKDFSLGELSYVMISIGFIAFNILAIGNHIMNKSLSSFFIPLKNIDYIIAVVYLGILSSIGASFLTNFVLSKIEASQMCVFTNLATVISIVAGLVFLNEEIFYYHIIGSVLIITGVIGVNLFGEEKRKI